MIIKSYLTFIEEVNKFVEVIGLCRVLCILLSIYLNPVLLVVGQVLLEALLKVIREVVTGSILAEDLANLHDEPGAFEGVLFFDCCKTGVSV